MIRREEPATAPPRRTEPRTRQIRRLTPPTHVRTLALIELVFVYIVSHRFFREKIAPREFAGMALLALGLAIVTIAR